jgi:hypothetical protein
MHRREADRVKTNSARLVTREMKVCKVVPWWKKREDAAQQDHAVIRPWAADDALFLFDEDGSSRRGVAVAQGEHTGVPFEPGMAATLLKVAYDKSTNQVGKDERPCVPGLVVAGFQVVAVTPPPLTQKLQQSTSWTA